MADREPASTDGRLSDVNPGSMPPADHAQHDRWLVVRVASHDDDLTVAETTTAQAWLMQCADCAALAADIGTITRATASSIVPARPRDFRLTPAQAARANGGFLERLGRWLSSPRGSVVRPLAGATLAIGIVLVAVGPTIRQPLQQPSPPSAQAGTPAADATMDPALMMESGPAASTDAAGGQEGTSAMMIADATPGASPDVARVGTAPGASPAADQATPVAKATPDPQTADLQVVPGATPDPDSGNDTAVEGTQIQPSDDTSMALVLLGIVLAGTALLVLLLTWLAHRMTRHQPQP